jgi:(4S)-4-hydroxy-5-phosphonooxypentane-2,3-dione isomerase
MHIIHVKIHVKPECVEAFTEATLINAHASRKEKGIARFDVIQELDDPTHFALVEVYRALEDHAKHRQTAHYATWAESVGPMMAEARSSVKYANVFPDDTEW